VRYNALRFFITVDLSLIQKVAGYSGQS